MTSRENYILLIEEITNFLVNLQSINIMTMILASISLAIGAPQIILIVVVVLLLFGGRKIPELMRGLGSGIKEFKDASKDDDEDTKKVDNK